MVLPVPVFSQIPPSNPMGPKPSQPQSGELFRPRLDEQISMWHQFEPVEHAFDTPGFAVKPRYGAY